MRCWGVGRRTVAQCRGETASGLAQPDRHRIGRDLQQRCDLADGQLSQARNSKTSRSRSGSCAKARARASRSARSGGWMGCRRRGEPRQQPRAAVRSATVSSNDATGYAKEPEPLFRGQLVGGSTPGDTEHVSGEIVGVLIGGHPPPDVSPDVIGVGPHEQLGSGLSAGPGSTSHLSRPAHVVSVPENSSPILAGRTRLGRGAPPAEPHAPCAAHSIGRPPA